VKRQQTVKDASFSEPAEKDDLIHAIAAACSEWIYTPETSSPPVSKKLKLGPQETRVYHLTFEVLQVALADSSQQEQLALLAANVSSTTTLKSFRALVLTYRGTCRVQDWLANSSPIINHEAFAQYGIGVHAAWYGLACNPRQQTEICKALVQEAARGTSQFLMTGHSMGGAVAQICTLKVLTLLGDTSLQQDLTPDALELLRTVKCVAFGSPMPFAPDEKQSLNEEVRKDHCKALDWMAERTINYVNNNDLVPRLPGGIHFVLSTIKNCKPIGLIPVYGSINVYQALVTALEGAPATLRYRHICSTAFVGHAVASHQALKPSDAKFTELMCFRQPTDDAFDRCSVRGNFIACKFQSWWTAGAINAIKDHMVDRYQGYMQTARGIYDQSTGALVFRKALRKAMKMQHGLIPNEQMPKELI